MADSTPTDSVSVDMDSISPSPKASFYLSAFSLFIFFSNEVDAAMLKTSKILVSWSRTLLQVFY
ncbi:hypothetical protein TSUD_06420 [Trifolium subterraneum]|uniref:Uncharacterized protein n=1 Tax=Trifolium subterraneum TaxID=3900 RepID=A0A2Z6MTF5_TRISU|nr:hypothetical protein TSUD_06420 [Trifolium subterraneum]